MRRGYAGWLLIILGVAFFLANRDIISWKLIGQVWPLILIFIGILILGNRRGH